ncbi:hypothetical protein MHU86_12513 [Fragilaria crotonensis]|nr:hypothetical protein MHU86_12513 [Fragilaria crotonensis]
MDDFMSKLRVWSESTTTSPSGLHLGHYKALIARHSYSSDLPDDELTPEFRRNRDELDMMQNDLRTLHLNLLNYALERGYSYKRWQTIANTILFKDPDNVRLHRTRVIHIYEADFNLALGIKWRIQMYQAEALAALNDGQYGSRPRRNATDPVFIEELQCEISRATRRSVVLINYDALACFDRMIQNAAMIVSRKFGVPLPVTQANAVTLERAEFRVRTELGLAPNGYVHSDSKPIYGTGQGSANSPAIWCFLSSCLMDAYDTTATPAVYMHFICNNQLVAACNLTIYKKSELNLDLFPHAADEVSHPRMRTWHASCVSPRYFGLSRCPNIPHSWQNSFSHAAI